MDKSNSNLTHIIAKYLKYMGFYKSASKLTLKAYKQDLEQFFGKNTHFQNNKNLEDFLKTSLKTGFKLWSKWSPSTRNRKISAVKSFLNWLYKEKYIQENLNRKMKSPKVPKKIPNFLSLDEVSSLIRILENALENEVTEKTASRDLALILLLYGGGLRVSEACHTQWNDLNFSKKTLKIKGKGSKERLIVLPDKTIQHLKKLKKPGNYIFGLKPLDTKTAYSIVRKWGIRAGIKKPISPHVLRHSYATHLLESGSDLRIIQELLGHRSLSATQKYTQIRLFQLTQTLTKYHPVTSKKVK